MGCDWTDEMRKNSGNGPEHISVGVKRVLRDIITRAQNPSHKPEAACRSSAAVCDKTTQRSGEPQKAISERNHE